MNRQHDAIVIGGGIVGLSTALALMQDAGVRRVAVVEKEADLGLHQTGRNSGVIHAGVYYQPGSLKARLCREGLVRKSCPAIGRSDLLPHPPGVRAQAVARDGRLIDDFLFHETEGGSTCATHRRRPRRRRCRSARASPRWRRPGSPACSAEG